MGDVGLVFWQQAIVFLVVGIMVVVVVERRVRKSKGQEHDMDHKLDQLEEKFKGVGR